MAITIRDRVAIGFRELELELGASDREVTQIRDRARARDIDRRHGPVTAARARK
jgi:hypothetical protein